MLYHDLYVQQAIGRPQTMKQVTVKVVMNSMFILNVIRCLIIMWCPNLSEGTKMLLGNLMEELGYNNSRMFYMTAVAYGVVVIAFQVLFEIAEYSDGEKDEFLTDAFDIENKLRQWDLSLHEQNEMRSKTVKLLLLCRLMAITGVSVTFVMLFIALILKLYAAPSHVLIAIMWYPVICLYVYRQTTVFFYTLIILFVSVSAIDQLEQVPHKHTTGKSLDHVHGET